MTGPVCLILLDQYNTRLGFCQKSMDVHVHETCICSDILFIVLQRLGAQLCTCTTCTLYEGVGSKITEVGSKRSMPSSISPNKILSSCCRLFCGVVLKVQHTDKPHCPVMLLCLYKPAAILLRIP